MLPTTRPEVADSWRRSAAAGVDVDSQESPVTLGTDIITDYRSSHRLSGVYPLLEEVLGQAARACDALLALTDEAGQLLWVSGSPATLRKAETIGFVEGANWDERLAGTNAPGTALATNRPVVVTGAEHYRVSVKPWNCAASPIHDPGSGAILGVLDITGGAAVAVPQTIAMVRGRPARRDRAGPAEHGAGMGRYAVGSPGAGRARPADLRELPPAGAGTAGGSPAARQPHRGPEPSAYRDRGPAGGCPQGTQRGGAGGAALPARRDRLDGARRAQPVAPAGRRGHGGLAALPTPGRAGRGLARGAGSSGSGRRGVGVARLPRSGGCRTRRRRASRRFASRCRRSYVRRSCTAGGWT